MLVFFGDSILMGAASRYQKRNGTGVSSQCVVGETSRDALGRVGLLKYSKGDTVIIGYGCNDYRKGVPVHEYAGNMRKIILAIKSTGSRVIPVTVTPARNIGGGSFNRQPDIYSESLRGVARELRIKIADINDVWYRNTKDPSKGLKPDGYHPDSTGHGYIRKALGWIIPRDRTTVLWEYNGREAKCNYRCPYCYYIGLHSPVDAFHGSIQKWYDSFKTGFGDQPLTFYLAHGEPTFGGKFLDIVDMVNGEPEWEIRITSNISYNLKEIVSSTCAREGRFNINASFHPSMIDRDKFLERILFLREHGIEVPVVYVVYPDYVPRFLDDVNFFRKHGFVLHVRRFRGKYKGKRYPESYTPTERDMICRYCDDGTIKYMMNPPSFHNKLTFAGAHFFVVANTGEVGYDSDAFQKGSKHFGMLGNILDGTFEPKMSVTGYPGTRVGTVDGIANMVDTSYKPLYGNNVLNFARQGGVYCDGGSVVYGNENVNFRDPGVLRKYGLC